MSGKSVSPIMPLVVCCLVVAADQLTKFLVVRNFDLYESLEIIPGLFNLTYITNTGAAFGFLSGEPAAWRKYFFVAVAVGALIFLVVAYRQFRQEGRLVVLALSLIGGGAIGNLVDRIRQGKVIDFLDFYISHYHWPAFNVADSAITIGVACFLVGQLFFHHKKQNRYVEEK